MTHRPADIPVSVIICAKNEARNLEANLPAILSQIYANEAGKAMYEVIVVNDASTDDTANILQQLEQRYDNLWSVHIGLDATRDLKGKKYALSKGLAHATNSCLVFTDADCIPASEYWLQNMVAPLDTGKAIVAGYGKYARKPGVLNAWIRWETVHTFLQYSSFSIAGKPYMAVGRNMVCTRDLFMKAASDPLWNAVPSGDDDLLMNLVATAENTAIAHNKEAFTTSPAKSTWAAWLAQKQRHMSTGKYYKAGIKRLLGAYGFSHSFTWLLFLGLPFTPLYKIVLVLMLLRCLLFWSMMLAASQKLDEKFIFSIPFFDLGWMLYNFVLSPYILFKNKNRWT